MSNIGINIATNIMLVAARFISSRSVGITMLSCRVIAMGLIIIIKPINGRMSAMKTGAKNEEMIVVTNAMTITAMATVGAKVMDMAKAIKTIKFLPGFFV